jgi:hypothetical protein
MNENYKIYYYSNEQFSSFRTIFLIIILFTIQINGEINDKKDLVKNLFTYLNKNSKFYLFFVQIKFQFSTFLFIYLGDKFLDLSEFEQLFNKQQEDNGYVADILRKIQHPSNTNKILSLKQIFKSESNDDTKKTFQIAKQSSNHQKQMAKNESLKNDKTENLIKNMEILLNSLNNVYKVLVIFSIIFSLLSFFTLCLFFYLTVLRKYSKKAANIIV